MSNDLFSQLPPSPAASVEVMLTCGGGGFGTAKAKKKETHQRQSPMPPHTMPHHTNPLPIQHLKPLPQLPRQLLRDITIHMIPLPPGLPRRINIKPGPSAKIIRVVFAFDLETARAGIRPHNRYPPLTGLMLQKPLLRAVIARACQAGEEEEHWHFS